MNKEQDQLEYRILTRYFSGDASEEEKDRIFKCLSDTENPYKSEKCLRLLWEDIRANGNLAVSGEMEMPSAGPTLDRIHHEINLKSRQDVGKRLRIAAGKDRKSYRLVFKYLGRAAAILLLPVLGYIGWGIHQQTNWLANQPEVVYHEIQCPLGAMCRFELPDGTTGNLNNGSSLIYPDKFTGETRDVELYGEAFFDVEKNKKRPFLIKTVGLDVKVTGTKLNVYSYPDETYQEFTLETGSAELIRDSESEGGEELSIAEMKPGQHITYIFPDHGKTSIPREMKRELIVVTDQKELNKIAPKLRQKQEALYKSEEGNLFVKFDDIEPYTGWTEGKLILRNDPMPVLLKRIERWYSVKFNVQDERINEYTYWATFEEENIDQVLKLLSLTGPIDFIRHPRKQKADGTFENESIDVFIDQ